MFCSWLFLKLKDIFKYTFMKNLSKTKWLSDEDDLMKSRRVGLSIFRILSISKQKYEGEINFIDASVPP